MIVPPLVERDADPLEIVAAARVEVCAAILPKGLPLAFPAGAGATAPAVLLLLAAISATGTEIDVEGKVELCAATVPENAGSDELYDATVEFVATVPAEPSE